ncbi:MAG: hypothetical protein AAGB34_01535 [Planctomycetota bacterium]
MAIPSPIHPMHERAEAIFLPYASPDQAGEPAMVVEAYASVEVEYAAIRKGVALFDEPHLGSIRISGDDGVEFLNRMVTQQLDGLNPYQHRRSFWLSRKGRIDADLRLAFDGSQILAEVDVLVAASVAESLSQYVFAEDVTFTDVSDELHRMSLHGPKGIDLLSSIATPSAGPVLATIEEGQSAVVTVEGFEVHIDRGDITGQPGLRLAMPKDGAAAIWEALLRADAEAEHTFALKPAGWHAINIARLEGGTPVFNVDFGTNSLPAETSLLDQRVDFTKGCYLGQEVVARMHSLGHPKQVLVALQADASTPEDGQPQTGMALLSKGSDNSIGAITSSVRSPMLSNAVICFAMVKWGHHEAGTVLETVTAAGHTELTVQEQLTFWKPD